MSARVPVEEPFLLRHSRACLALAFLFASTACAIRHVDFRPRERVDGESPGGHPAASYELVGEQHGGSSELHVWSSGATLGEQNNTLRIGFEIENRFDEPCRLDLEATRIVELQVYDSAQPIQNELAHPTVLGADSVEAGDAGTIELVYVLPPGVEPGDVRAFSVAWTVGTPEVFDQRTPFRRAPKTRGSRPFGGTYSSAGYFPFYFYRSSGFGFSRRFSGRHCLPVYAH